MNILKFSNLNLFWRAFRQYRFYIIWLGVLSVIGGLLEGIGINAIVPLFAFIDKTSVAEMDIISRTLKQLFVFLGISFSVKTILIFILALFIVKAIMLFYTNNLTCKITTQYEKDSRLELFRLMTETDWPHLAQQKIGHLDQLLTTYVTNGAGLLSVVSFLMLSTVNLLVYGLIIVNISPLTAILVGIVGILLFFLFKPLFYKNNKISEKSASSYKQLSHYVNEHIIGMKVIKSMSVEREVVKNSEGHFDYMRELSMGVYSARNLTNSLLQPMGVILILGIFAFFYKTEAFTFGSFAVVVYAIQRLFSQIQVVQSQIHGVSSGFPYLAGMVRYKDDAIKNKEKNTGTKEFVFKNSLDFKRVDFSYNNGADVISGINFSLKKGEILGLIGPSGAGKTTIVDLLLRLYQPQKGIIELDGADVSGIKMKEWRTNIGYVPQEAFLLNDTIENNIKFYDNSITYEDMVSAVKMANIYEFIEEQPQKFQTAVGERGTLLSGGQRQRIALARVLARKPQILILDEATSSLDNESELFIQKAIEGLKGKMTILIIAHRLSTVMIADNLMILEKGNIIESGSPKDLLQDENTYFYKNFNLMEKNYGGN